MWCGERSGSGVGGGAAVPSSSIGQWGNNGQRTKKERKTVEHTKHQTTYIFKLKLKLKLKNAPDVDDVVRRRVAPEARNEHIAPPRSQGLTGLLRGVGGRRVVEPPPLGAREEGWWGRWCVWIVWA
jgi:hypothetical protein